MVGAKGRAVTMPNHRCECCTSRTGFLRNGRVVYDHHEIQELVSAFLCDPCSRGNHAIGRCKGCGVNVWHCARMSHVSLYHPQILAQRGMMKQGPAPVPGLRYLGRIMLPEEESY